MSAAHDRPRLLRATPGPDDYTASSFLAARGEPEAVAEVVVDEFARQAEAKRLARRAEAVAQAAAFCGGIERAVVTQRRRLGAVGALDKRAYDEFDVMRRAAVRLRQYLG